MPSTSMIDLLIMQSNAICKKTYTRMRPCFVPMARSLSSGSISMAVGLLGNPC